MKKRQVFHFSPNEIIKNWSTYTWADVILHKYSLSVILFFCGESFYHFFSIIQEGGEYYSRDNFTDYFQRPIGVHQYWFQELRFGTVYHVRMTSRNLKWHDFESNLTKLEFKTPTCLESFNFRFNKCGMLTFTYSHIFFPEKVILK